jgi:hypothetical protein
MKKRNLKTLSLNKQSISKLDNKTIIGGLEVPIAPDTTLEPINTTVEPITSITTLDPINTINTGVGSGSQNNSQCGYSCDPNLCGSVEPWGC